MPTDSHFTELPLSFSVHWTIDSLKMVHDSVKPGDSEHDCCIFDMDTLGTKAEKEVGFGEGAGVVAKVGAEVVGVLVG